MLACEHGEWARLSTLALEAEPNRCSLCFVRPCHVTPKIYVANASPQYSCPTTPVSKLVSGRCLTSLLYMIAASLQAFGSRIDSMLVNDQGVQGQVPAKVTLKRFYRPEDISIDTAYRANLYEVYASNETESAEVDSFVGKCSVGLEAGEPGKYPVQPWIQNRMHVHMCSSKLVHVVAAVQSMSAMFAKANTQMPCL